MTEEISGLPTRRVESWHYTDLRRLLASVPAFDASAEAKPIAALLEGSTLLSIVNGVSAATPSVDGVTFQRLGDKLVEQLVDQIIRVESGGKADAKNPLSSATGLGQFISSTWLRMMQQYRPDLAGSMSKEDLLALRNDPTISREMVTALAREGEGYLRARGHEITAGRLYLCHFLGAEGANMVLAATDDQLVGDVMGAGVIKANPFLQGRTIAYVKEWAEIKMNKKGGVVLPSVAATPPEVLAYQKSEAAFTCTELTAHAKTNFEVVSRINSDKSRFNPVARGRLSH